MAGRAKVGGAKEAPGKARDQSAPDEKPEVRGSTLDGKTWIRYSISIWDDVVKSPEERRYDHPAMFPTALTDRLIELFGPARGGVVLDPFAGSGSTLCSAYRHGYRSLGFELSEEYTDLARRRLAELGAVPGEPHYPRLIRGDSRRLPEYVAPTSVGLCVTSPPYWDILNQRRTADRKSIRNYGAEPRDLGRIAGYDAFLDALREVFARVFDSLVSRAYCVVVVMDVRKKADFFPLHMDVTLKLKEVGLVLDDIIIWDRRQEYNHLRPLGYPHVFRVNKVHEFILIFQKRV
ncbi:MAG: site-specific DNA-methyltransferase [Candidatus Desulforudis sp.]|nr:site-specific DNA-methyltransferase [Desulforudis sp.]